MIVAIDNTIVNVALPTLQVELNTTGSELQWIVDAYILAFAALLLTMGSLGDRWGRALLLRGGIIVFGAASLGATFADSPLQLLITRAVMGLGASAIMPATLAIITNVFPREERGKALGAWGGVIGAGVALGPIMGGVLIEYVNWAAIFFINVPIVIVALIGGHFFVPDSRDPNPRKPDIPGTLISGAALALMVFGLIKGGDWGWEKASVIGTLAAAVLLFIAFGFWERHTTHPMLDMWLFRNWRFSAGVGSVTLLMLGQMGLIFGLTQYMQFVLGYSALGTGIRFLPFAVGVGIGANVSPRLVRRIGTNRVLAAAFMGVAIIIGAASLWEADTSFWVLGPMFFAFAYCMGHVMPICSDAILGAVPEARAGVGSATNSASVQVGAAIGVAALGSALSTVYSSHIDPTLKSITALPAEAADAARDSVGAALKIASELPSPIGETLAAASKESFMDGWQVMVLIMAGLMVFAAAFALKFMPPQHLPQEQMDRLAAQYS